MAKPVTQSKSMWLGFSATAVGIIALLADFWSLLTFEQMVILEDLIGPELLALIGAAIMFLRVVTTSPVFFRQPPLEDIDDEGDIG